MSVLHWVVGAGGLLGSAVTRCLTARGEATFRGPTVRWAGPDAELDLRQGLARLVEQAGEDGWQVFWCAGVGVTGSSDAALQTEVERFEALLDAMHALPPQLQQRGSLFVASSAGALYAGSPGAPFDESTPPVPLGGYGRAKLALEAATERLATASEVRCLSGRISNLYGPGQSLTKPQGLISHLCLANLKRAPLSVYVSLDTLRDYLFVDDAAALIVDSCSRLRESDQRYHVKVLASGRSLSIGALLGEFRRVIGRRPEIVMGASSQSALQSRDLRVRSTHWADLDHREMTTIPDGIARTLQDIRRSLFAGG